MSAVTTAKLQTGQGLRQVVRDYITLTKPRVVSLLLVTALAGMLVAQQGWPGTELVIAVLVGGYLAAGGANAINMWFDRDIDAEMYRTRQRPIPAGRVRPGSALAYGTVLNALAFILIATVANLLAAALTLTATLVYVFVYTMWLKRSTPQNIVIGGAAGAFPPVIGYVAVTGSLDLVALYMFMIVFFWTPPHFWALALRLNADYDRAQVPMLQVVRGRQETERQVFLYSVVLPGDHPAAGSPWLWHLLHGLGSGAGSRLRGDGGDDDARPRHALGAADLQILAFVPGPGLWGHGGRRPPEGRGCYSIN